MINLNMRGAIIYAGNNSLLNMCVHRDLTGAPIGYEKLTTSKTKKGDISATCEKELPGGTSRYTMIAVSDGREYVLYAPTHMRGAKCEAWEDPGKKKRAKGLLKMEHRRNADKTWIKRGDSSGMFQKNAEALKRKYHFSDVLSFANVNDDGEEIKHADKVTRQHFLDTMGQFKGQYDFFAYCGHGVKSGLLSGCVFMHDGHQEFLGHLQRILKPGAPIVLYACSTGQAGGFAEKLAGEMHGSKVFAHLTAGRGDSNPKAVVYEGHKGETFQEWLGKAAFAKWKGQMKEHTDLYLEFPWLSKAELLHKLGVAA